MLSPNDFDIIKERVLMNYETLFAQDDERSTVDSHIIELAAEIAVRTIEKYDERIAEVSD